MPCRGIYHPETKKGIL